MHAYRILATVATTDGARRPGKGHVPRSLASTSSGGKDNELLRMLARLSLRQEDALAQLSLDKIFIFFIQFGRGNIMPNMFTKAKEWNEFKEKGGMTMPLRMTMFLHYFQMLALCAKQLKLNANEDALIQKLRSKDILTEDHKWVYLTWDNQAMMLKPNQLQPLTSEEIRSHLRQQPSVIHKFSALRPVN